MMHEASLTPSAKSKRSQRIGLQGRYLFFVDILARSPGFDASPSALNFPPCSGSSSLEGENLEILREKGSRALERGETSQLFAF